MVPLLKLGNSKQKFELKKWFHSLPLIMTLGNMLNDSDLGIVVKNPPRDFLAIKAGLNRKPGKNRWSGIIALTLAKCSLVDSKEESFEDHLKKCLS